MTYRSSLIVARSDPGKAPVRVCSAAGAVQVIFVTVDPERDNTAQIKDFLEAFDPSFIGATGEPDALATVRQNYGVTAIKQVTSDGYVMNHSSSICAPPW